jgi:hypothetical protein
MKAVLGFNLDLRNPSDAIMITTVHELQPHGFTNRVNSECKLFTEVPNIQAEHGDHFQNLL